MKSIKIQLDDCAAQVSDNREILISLDMSDEWVVITFDQLALINQAVQEIIGEL